MEPIDYLRAVRARWYLIVAAGLVGLVATWLTTPDRPAPQQVGIEQYTATHTLIQEEIGSEGRSVDLNRAALLTRTGEVPRRVAQKLGLDVSPAVLATSVNVQTDVDVRALRITVTDRDGPTAALLADTFAAEIVAHLDERERARQQRLIDVANARADALERQSIELQAQIPTLRPDRQALAQAQYEALVRQFGVAYEQAQAIASQDPTLSGLVTLEEATPVGVAQGGIRAPATRGGRMLLLVPLALALGVGLVLLLHRVDTRLRTREDAEAAFALPVVAEVPLLSRRQRRRLSVPRPHTDPPHVAEAFRTLRSSVRFMAPLSFTPDPATQPGTATAASAASATGAEVLLVTSPGVAEGKTTVVCNLAASFARAGHSVLVLDFDAANADTASRLGAVGGALGLSPTERNVRADDLARPTAVPGVRVVADWMREDTGDAAELGAALVSSARSAADVVIVDTPGLLVASDAIELVSTADVVVMVCRAGVTSASSARRAAEMLGRFRATALGVVLVGAGAGAGQPLLPFRHARRRPAHRGGGGSTLSPDAPAPSQESGPVQRDADVPAHAAASGVPTPAPAPAAAALPQEPLRRTTDPPVTAAAAGAHPPVRPGRSPVPGSQPDPVTGPAPLPPVAAAAAHIPAPGERPQPAAPFAVREPPAAHCAALIPLAPPVSTLRPGAVPRAVTAVHPSATGRGPVRTTPAASAGGAPAASVAPATPAALEPGTPLAATPAPAPPTPPAATPAAPPHAASALVTAPPAPPRPAPVPPRPAVGAASAGCASTPSLGRVNSIPPGHRRPSVARGLGIAMTTALRSFRKSR